MMAKNQSLGRGKAIALPLQDVPHFQFEMV
jgi:hypothetical protein